MNLSRAVDRGRHQLRRPVARTPYLWDLAMFVRAGKRATLARRDTAIVFDGYLRSGNTFSVAAFQVANGAELHVGRHLHGACHIQRAVRLRLPTVVLVRRPRDALLSYVIRRNTLTPHDAVIEYLDFYQGAWSAREGFVVGLFDQVISDFGAVIDEVNARFGTSFNRFDHSAEHEAEAFALVEEMNRRECWGEVVETHVGRPSAHRSHQKDALAGLLEAPRTAARLREANRLYERYAQLSAERATQLRPST